MDENRPSLYFLIGNKRFFKKDIFSIRDFLHTRFKSGYNSLTSVLGCRRIFIFNKNLINQTAYLESINYIDRIVPASLLVSNFINSINSFTADIPIDCSKFDLTPSKIIDLKTSPLLFWNAFLQAASYNKQWGNSKFDDISTKYTKATHADFEKISKSFIKLTDVTYWGFNFLSYFNFSLEKVFLKWLMSNELNAIRNFVNEIMLSAPNDSFPFRLFQANKSHIQDEVIYQMISTYSETFSNLSKVFYDIAVSSSLRAQLRKEQIATINSEFEIGFVPKISKFDFLDLDAIKKKLEQNDLPPSNDEDFESEPVYHHLTNPSNVRHISDSSSAFPSPYPENNLSSTNLPTKNSLLSSQSIITNELPAGVESENNSESISVDLNGLDKIDSSSVAENSFASSVSTNVFYESIPAPRPCNFSVNCDHDDYPLNVRGYGRHILKNNGSCYNYNTNTPMLTLKLCRNLKLLNACILESYRLCPPVCSQLWIVNGKLGDNKDSTKLVDKVSSQLTDGGRLKCGDMHELCARWRFVCGGGRSDRGLFIEHEFQLLWQREHKHEHERVVYGGIGADDEWIEHARIKEHRENL
ncbi:hypothetical protein AYI70_g12285 [Smittium culicis]|uniref:Uncharacterized protein n=1 Tax=Smittium culicis TaxID=133412 RepID=A0A1R1WY45_9FUNG|nr:hypothetical protein AYI70_g12285 [Smittium culicis]